MGTLNGKNTSCVSGLPRNGSDPDLNFSCVTKADSKEADDNAEVMCGGIISKGKIYVTVLNYS